MDYERRDGGWAPGRDGRVVLDDPMNQRNVHTPAHHIGAQQQTPVDNHSSIIYGLIHF